MRVLGFKYEAHKKYYFVDRHKKEGTLNYRKEYIKEMLELELKMYQWVQIKESGVSVYEKKHGLLTSTGLNFLRPLMGNNMVKYHVDACKNFHELMQKTKWGNLSVRMQIGTRPVVLLGQDECIFK